MNVVRSIKQVYTTGTQAAVGEQAELPFESARWTSLNKTLFLPFKRVRLPVVGEIALPFPAREQQKRLHQAR